MRRALVAIVVVSVLGIGVASQAAAAPRFERTAEKTWVRVIFDRVGGLLGSLFDKEGSHLDPWGVASSPPAGGGNTGHATGEGPSRGGLATR